MQGGDSERTEMHVLGCGFGVCFASHTTAQALTVTSGVAGQCMLVHVITLLLYWTVSCIMQAGAVVQQNLSQIRTVAAYHGEEAAAKEYDSKLDLPQKVRLQHCALFDLDTAVVHSDTTAQACILC